MVGLEANESAPTAVYAAGAGEAQELGALTPFKSTALRNDEAQQIGDMSLLNVALLFWLYTVTILLMTRDVAGRS